MHSSAFRHLVLGCGWVLAAGSGALALGAAGPLAPCDQLGCSFWSSPMGPWLGVSLGTLLGLRAE